MNQKVNFHQKQQNPVMKQGKLNQNVNIAMVTVFEIWSSLDWQRGTTFPVVCYL